MKTKAFYGGVAVCTVALLFGGLSIIRAIDTATVDARMATANSDLNLFRYHQHQRLQRIIRETRAIQAAAEILIRDANAASTDAGSTYYNDISELFAKTLTNVTGIDHIRLLSIEGLERVRVNRGQNGGVVRVAQADLQDKSRHPYVKAIAAMGVNGIYTSPVTLNEEHGRLDPRRISVIRSGVALTDAAGQPADLLVLNFNDPLTPFEPATDVSQQPEIYWLEGRGEFLYGGRRFGEREFRWQTGVKAKSFSEEFPALWGRILKEPVGQADLPDGRYIWLTTRKAEAIEAYAAMDAGTPRFAAAVQFLPNEFLYSDLVLKTPGGWGAVLIVIALYFGLLVLAIKERATRFREHQALADAKTANAKIEHEAARRTRLLSTVSHELRTPAASISMLLGNISRPKTNEEQEIQELSDHLLRLMDELKRIGSPQSQGIIEFKSARPSEIIDEACSQSAYIISASRMGVRINVPLAAERHITVDRYRLSTVVANLIRNGCVHSGGDALWLSAELREVNQQKGLWELRILVEDNGKGIPVDKRAFIFEEFAKAYQNSDGMGLGLAVSSNWIKEMGGSLVYFESAHGGAGFKVRIPVTEVEEDKIGVPGLPPDEKLLNGKRLLCVEDDRMVLRLTRVLMERLGATVTTAADGEEGLKLILEQSFDMIVTDYFMPNMDGVEMVKAVRARGITTPILAATAATLGLEAKELKDAGADDVVTKPLKVDDIKQFVDAQARVPGSGLYRVTKA